MLRSIDLIPDDFNYKEYIKTYELNKLLNVKTSELPIDLKEKIIHSTTFSVDKENKVPFPPEFDDLCRLHYITISRKVTTILEFGLGKSTSIFGNALYLNKKNFYKYSSKNLRRGNLYESHSIDNYQSWINQTRENIPEYLFNGNYVNLHLSKLITSEFNGRICTFYDPLPNISPDLIYLDGPDQYSAIGDIRGLSSKHQDRMPMSGDILALEHFLQPGTLIIVDGRTANARFLSSNFQRKWAHYHSYKWDQHFFELQETPLGIYNERMIRHCLGNEFFDRIKDY